MINGFSVHKEFNKERAKIIEDAFLKKGIVDSCLQCNQVGIFYFTEGKLFLGLSPERSINFLEVVIRICDNCGHVSQYASGYLGILPEEIKNDK